MVDAAQTPDPAPPDADRARALLLDMAEVGLRLTHALERHVLAAERTQAHVALTDPDATIMPACDLAGVALAFNRISRAVRMTLALHARLARPWPFRTPPANRASAAASVATGLPEDDDPDRPLREEARETLFDTPDTEDLFDLRGVGLVVADADPQPIPAGAAPLASLSPAQPARPQAIQPGSHDPRFAPNHIPP